MGVWGGREEGKRGREEGKRGREGIKSNGKEKNEGNEENRKKMNNGLARYCSVIVLYWLIFYNEACGVFIGE